MALWALAASILSASCAKAPAKVGAPGDELRSFLGRDVATGQQYCPVCAVSGKPVILVMGDASDPALDGDLARVQQIVGTSTQTGLEAIAMVGRIQGARLEALADFERGVAELGERRRKLGLRFPLLTVPAKLSEQEQSSHPRFDEVYRVEKSRTVLAADADGKVLYAEALSPERAEAQLAALERVMRPLAKSTR